MARTRSLKELFDIVINHHAYFNSGAVTIYMCRAADYAHIRGAISIEECVCVKDACMALVDSYEYASCSLEGALHIVGKIHGNMSDKKIAKIVKEVWETYIKTL